MASSPTQRSLKLLRDEGYTAQVVERWNPHARVRQDLFGVIDTAAMIWWSKSQMRWAETQKHEHTGTDGAPIEIKKIERVIVDQSAQSKKD